MTACNFDYTQSHIVQPRNKRLKLFHFSISNIGLCYSLLHAKFSSNCGKVSSILEIRCPLLSRILKWKLFFYIKLIIWGHLGSFLEIQKLWPTTHFLAILNVVTFWSENYFSTSYTSNGVTWGHFLKFKHFDLNI